jgi:carboxyl-terminal processing protease
LFINKVLIKALGLIPVVGLLVLPGWSEHFSSLDRERAQVMLQNVASDIRKYYYDPKLHGVDWDAQVGKAKEKIAKATSMGEATLEIAAALEALDDSHTFFVPPHDPIPEDYGWQFQMIGARCYVTHVRPKSDAETKGLKPGDEVLTINGFTPTREGMKKMEYVLGLLLPQRGLRVDLRDHSSKIRQVDVMAKVRQARTITDLDNVTGRDAWFLRLEGEDQRRLMRPQYKELGTQLIIMKLPRFLEPDSDVQAMIGKARGHSGLIVDLRGNPGGIESALQDLLSSVFQSDVKIADRVAREGAPTVMAKSTHHNAFTGKLIVLVDSESASAAELFARVIQIEKRGTVLGDRTSGSVMEAKHYSHRTGLNPVFVFGTSVTYADLVMADGKSLEHVGVTPDETSLPSAADLANDRDPAMARAAEIMGVTLSPEEAGKLFPHEWPRN